jgi:hypothetical protein
MMLTLSVFAYVCIAALFFNMSFKEYQTKAAHDVSGLVLTGLACAAWPAVAFLLLIAVNLSATSPGRIDRTI